VFVGRGPQLQRLADAIGRAREGDPYVILVAGEAGVGKTRFITECVARARADGVEVMTGGCIELGGAGLPFAPIIEALRGLTAGRDSSEVDAILGPGRRELARFVPELGAATPSREGPGLAYESAQGRLFEAFLGLINRLAHDRPLLFVAEDVHWADRSTLELLSFVVRNLRDTATVVVLSFRSDELHRRHPLLPFLAELERRRPTTRIDLSRFDRMELAEQLSAIGGVEADRELAERIYVRSEGNPFFAEELLAASTASAYLPEALRDLLIARIGSLTEQTQEMLRIAAAAGSRFDTGLLARVAGWTDQDLHRALREAVEFHVVTPQDGLGDAGYAFRHALVQEAVYGELLPDERTRLHAAFAGALAWDVDRAGDPTHAAQVAYHWFAAHDVPRALEASVAAATTAETAFAFSDAHLHYERALALWDQAPDPERLAGLDRVELLMRAAQAGLGSAAPRSVGLVKEAIGYVDASRDPARAGVLQGRLCRYSWSAGDGVTALAACHEAVRLVPATPTVERARVLAGLGQILMVVGSWAESRPWLEKALAVAKQVGASDVEGHALNSLGVTMGYTGDIDGGLESLRRAREIGLAIGNFDDVARALENTVDLLVATGRLEDAVVAAEEAYAFDEAHGLLQFYGLITLTSGIIALYRLGRWAEAAELAERGRRHESPGVAEIYLQQRLALLDVGVGRHKAAERRVALLHRLSERVVEAQMFTPMAEAGAELAIWQGRPLDARREILDALAHLPWIDPGLIARIGPLYALGLRAEADLVEGIHGKRDPAALMEARANADRYLGEIRQLHETIVAGLPAFAPLSNAFRAISEAEYGRLGGTSDPAAWSNAADAFAPFPIPYSQAYARWREGEAILAASLPRSLAATPLREANRIALALGAGPLQREIEATARRARLDLDATRAGSALADRSEDPFGLTTREREVLALLAAGRSNRQIAETLFITENTAGVHVSHILGKLDVGSRTEAAAVAHQLGLLATGVVAEARPGS
jgi:DNA-binding CsgD family transcriptional regulator/tetratricopeptide (TPR) repeat protein